jgi:hypothetical protein
MCLNETYSKVHVSKDLSDVFPIENGRRQGDAFITAAFQLCLEYAIR